MQLEENPADHPHYRQTEEPPIDWSGELEAVHEDGRVQKVRLSGVRHQPDSDGDYTLEIGSLNGFDVYRSDGSSWSGGPWRIRNVPQPTPQADTKPDSDMGITISPDLTAGVTKPVQSKRPDDLVVLGNRTWRITGVYIGALGQESVVGLVSMDRRPPHVGEDEIDEMIVPEALVEGHVFRRALALAGEKEA